MRKGLASLALFGVVLGGCGGGGGGGGGSAGSTAAPITSSSQGTTPGTTTPGTTNPGTAPTNPAPGSGATPTPLALPSGPVGGARAEGVDVSYYQSTIDWSKVKAAGISFAIARVSDGTGFSDPRFAANWSGIKAQGLVRGVYQYFRASQDPTAQADLLVSKVGSFAPGDLPPILDIEEMDGQSASKTLSGINTWTARIKAKTGLTPVVYTSPSFWSTLGSPTNYDLSALWIAHWGVSSPSVPSASWKTWTLWQYTDSGTVSGITGKVDRNAFQGSVKDVRAYAGLNVGDDFFRGIAVNSTGKGYWTVGSDGGVFAYGDATFRGTPGGKTHPQPYLGIVRTPSGLGYWAFRADGTVTPFGDATPAGNAGMSTCAMAATPTGKGYWLLGRDGAVKQLGDAVFAGQPGTLPTGVVAVAITGTTSGKGYWVAFSDGSVSAFGDAPALGGASNLASPVTAMARTPSGKGYWLAQANGGVQGFGDAQALTYAGTKTSSAPVTAIASSLTGKGYWLLTGDGTVFASGDATDAGSRPR